MEKQLGTYLYFFKARSHILTETEPYKNTLHGNKHYKHAQGEFVAVFDLHKPMARREPSSMPHLLPIAGTRSHCNCSREVTGHCQETPATTIRSTDRRSGEDDEGQTRRPNTTSTLKESSPQRTEAEAS